MTPKEKAYHERSVVHGASRIGKRWPEYYVYTNAIGRCRNPKNKAYKDYGGRGIKFLFKSFQEFLQCVGRRPKEKLPSGRAKYWLERIKNNGHYAPDNVCWSTISDQMKNKRPALQMTQILRSEIKNLKRQITRLKTKEKTTAQRVFALASRIQKRDSWFIGGFLGTVEEEWEEQ